MNWILSPFRFLFYPLWLPIHVARDERASRNIKMLTAFFSALILLPIWVASYIFIGIAGATGLRYVGVIPIEIPVAGASMLPTFTEQEGVIAAHRYPRVSELNTIPRLSNVTSSLVPEIKKGDIVVFKNKETVRVFDAQNKDPRKTGGFVKRVVGVPGDVVTIRNGFVRVNGEIIDEPYTLKPRSTFGGDVIADCSVVQVSPGKLFVLGDNRKVSLDSRHIGLINYDDIQYYIPFNEQQTEFASRWRDTSNDEDSSFNSELDPEEFVRLLNERRTAIGKEPLALNPKLSQSAELRAKVMLEYNDLSFEASRSGYTIEDSFAEAGYSNVVYGEFPILGYYDAQELIDYFFEYNQAQDFLMRDDYQEIGISSFVGFLNGCPVQIVNQHLAGFVPPDYSAAEIEPWNELVRNLQTIREGWVRLKTTGSFYDENKADIDRINDVIRIRSANAKRIAERMEKNEWLTEAEKQLVEDEKVLFAEQNEIADRLNKKIEELQ